MNKETKVVFRDGKRIYLRPILESDIPYFLKWMNDEGLTKYLIVYLPQTEASEKRWFERVTKSDTDIIFAIVEKSTDKLIGTMGLHNISWKDRTATTGAIIGEAEYWDRGYGTEAKMLLLNYAFNTLNLRKICSSVRDFNARSVKYQKKCGYKEEGRRIEEHYVDGKYYDTILTAVFKKDWLPIWEIYKEKNLK